MVMGVPLASLPCAHADAGRQDGLTVVICDSESTVNEAAAPPKSTLLTPMNAWPLMVTVVPPVSGPVAGLKLAIEGGPASSETTLVMLGEPKPTQLVSSHISLREAARRNEGGAVQLAPSRHVGIVDPDGPAHVTGPHIGEKASGRHTVVGAGGVATRRRRTGGRTDGREIERQPGMRGCHIVQIPVLKGSVHTSRPGGGQPIRTREAHILPDVVVRVASLAAKQGGEAAAE